MLGEKLPLPEVVQTTPAATVNTAFRFTFALFPQTVTSGPALTVGAGVIVITIWSVAGGHPPLLVEVSVSVTVPAAMSAGLGL